VVLTTAILLLVSAAGGTLPTGSTFDTSNGSLTSTTKHDWNPAGSPAGNLGPVEPISCGTTVPGAGTNCGLDLTGKAVDSFGKGDNALGQGTKEDDTNVSVVNGSIPPQKDDLSRFYINSEKKPCVASSTVNCGTSSLHQFLYMAWERTNTLGSAHMDFEFNQAPVGITATSSGAEVLNRTLGDLLIDFDFGGSGVPVLALHRWISTSTPSADCETSTTSPCWGKGVTLTTSCTAAPATPCAEASVNGADVTDNNPPGAPRTLPGQTILDSRGNVKTINSTFGEAGIDLTAANVFPANKCFHLGDAWLKSRSSGNSFNSELKDFIAPIPINISNCGEIKIIKHSDPRGINQDFGFASDLGDPTPPVTVDSQPFCQADTSPSAFTLNDKSVAITGISAASPTVVTTAAAHGFTSGQTVTIAGSNSTPSIDGSRVVTVIDSTHFSVAVNVTTAGNAGAVVGDSPRNTEDCVNVLSADSNGNTITYHVTENNPLPPGFVLESLTCTAGANSSGAQDGTNQFKANITVAPGETVTCTYVDQQQLGAIKITKTSTKGNAALAGAKFSIKDPNGVALTGSPFTTDANGVICKDNLAFGDYKVQETSAPTGYKINDATEHTVTVDNNAKCTDDPYGGEAIAFDDTPLSTIEVKFTSLAGAGVTNSNIVCSVDANSENGGADSDSITSNSAANPTVVTTSAAHGLSNGAKVSITGSNSTPSIDGIWTVSGVTSTTFTIPVNVTAAGSSGTVTAFDDTDETFGNGTSGLVPGTYTCTVVIDP
jgi:hypothetical protein